MMGKKVGKTRGRKNKIKMKKDWHTCENRVGRKNKIKKKKKKRLTHMAFHFFFFLNYTYLRKWHPDPILKLKK